MEKQNATPATDRVRRNSSAAANEKIDGALRAHVRQYMSGDGVQLSERIAALEKEWSIERYIETFAPSLILAGSALAVYKDKRWVVLPIVVAAFLLQHGLQGWCPPLPVFRALGARTRKEIEWEKFALKILRGDFNTIDFNNEDVLLAAVKRIL